MRGSLAYNNPRPVLHLQMAGSQVQHWRYVPGIAGIIGRKGQGDSRCRAAHDQAAADP